MNANPILLMGVSGAGKTTVGQALAQRLDCALIDADHFHPQANKNKMAQGYPLTDADRWPWLQAVAAAVNQSPGSVCACSALKEVYRDYLQQRIQGLTIVFLSVPTAVLQHRLDNRQGHFFSPDLLASQLATLEEPAQAERVDGTLPVAQIVDVICTRLQM